jgi:uncharacterized protein
VEPAGQGEMHMMHERRVVFGDGTVRLEGLYTANRGTMGSIVSHPHPLMGGDMNNPVVEIITGSFSAVGLSTLRFNFRGVGLSEGTFDRGQGEQGDVLAAIAYLERQDIRELMLAGYSFGAWVNAGVILQRNVLPALFVSPPLTLLPFNFELLRGKVGLMICGDRDPYCPLDEARIVAGRASCPLEVVHGGDHFWHGREAELAARIQAFAAHLRTEKSFRDEKKY